MSASHQFDAILIDDDSLVHAMWSYAAKTMNKSVDLHFNVDSFLAKANEIDPRTPIYIDSNLGCGIRGEAVAQDLYRIGFREIYLATGHSADDFEPMEWIKGIVGKEPAWIST
jgi:hypothetical protein